MMKRIRTGLALSIWCGMVIFPSSLLFVIITENKLLEAYFIEGYLFYEIIAILGILFLIGFAIAGNEKRKKRGP